MLSKIAYPWFFFFRIARLSLLVFLPTLVLILTLYRISHKEGLVAQMTLQMEENLRTTRFTLESAKLDWKNWCEGMPKIESTRYSLVRKDGIIICDSLKERTGKSIQENVEIIDSFEKGFSTQVRYSDVFKTQAVFASLKISDQVAIRQVVPLSTLKDNLNRFDRIIFLRIIPFAFLSYLIFIYFFYRASIPLGVILSKVEKFKVDLPFNKTLQLLYQKDRWAEIEEALNEADQKLKIQIVQTRTENEKIGAILESIYDNIIAIDTYETVLFFNTNFKKNFMRERGQHEILPKIWHTFTDDKLLKAFISVLKTGETVSLKGMLGLSTHFPDRYYDLTITPLRTTEGRVNGALGVFYDVTEIKLIEQMRVDFVANVSHEIRTPLTSIKGYTQILQSQRAQMSPEFQQFLEKILSNSERMISLFNDLLNLSVIESNNLQRIEELDLDSLVDSISENITTNYKSKKIEVQKDITLKTIHGDYRLMEQVLSNLIDNACKYSGNELNVKISSFEKNGKAVITVKDNGPGISKEHLQRVFERFYRVDSSREFSRGTGLGLSIVKHIVSKHGGKIWAESEENSGTTFVIELPLK